MPAIKAQFAAALEQIRTAASPAWWRAELRAWIFVVKAVFAALLALWLAMRFDLSAPYTAMLSVFIVIRPESGLVLAKSFYRVLGTLTGAMVTLLLYALFPQQRILFLGGLVLWTGLCTMGTQRYRNFAAYAFVLAGYTACIIGIPATSHPEGAFDSAVARVSEVILGILCAGLISDALLPSRLADSLDLHIYDRYGRLLKFSAKALAAPLDPDELYQADQVFVADVIQLESQRSSTIFENMQSRSRDRQVLRLNHEFMAASTALRRLINWMHGLRAEGQALPEGAERYRRVDRIMHALYTDLAAHLKLAGSRVSGQQALAIARQLAHFYRQLPAAAAASSLGPDQADDEAELEQVIWLLGDFVLELWRHSLSYAAFCGQIPERALQAPPSSYVQAKPAPLISHNDRVVECLAGARTVLTLSLTSVLWITTAWPSGTDAVILGGVFSALFSAAPSPLQIFGKILQGFLLALLLGFICYTLVLPRMDGYFQLCLGLLPFLMVGAYLMTRPDWATVSSWFFILFCNGMAVRNVGIEYDTAQYLNKVLADLMAVASVSAVYSALIPVSGKWLRRRAHLGMREEVSRLCGAAAPMAIERFEGVMRDILFRLLAYPALSQQQLRSSIDEAQFQIDLGRTIIEIRQQLVRHPGQAIWHRRGEELLDRLAAWLAHPAPVHLEAALASAQAAIRAFRTGSAAAQAGDEDARRLFISTYHLSRILEWAARRPGRAVLADAHKP